MKGTEGGGASGILVVHNRGFIQREHFGDGSLDREAGRCRGIVEQNLHLLNLDLPAPLRELVANEDGELMIRGCAGDVGLGRDGAQ